MGLEPTTLGTTTRCSNRLSYIYHIKNKWSGREDSNLRPPGPKPGALTRLRYAPTNTFYLKKWTELYYIFLVLSSVFEDFLKKFIKSSKITKIVLIHLVEKMRLRKVFSLFFLLYNPIFLQLLHASLL
jgi:hypothetical protein